ncbi:MAG TPA: tetratricopeptide repeat protein [Pseudomonadota bacterium]|nr:tetratricopeptide repeat protein [Pseudomonadota bacterium]
MSASRRGIHRGMGQGRRWLGDGRRWLVSLPLVAGVTAAVAAGGAEPPATPTPPGAASQAQCKAALKNGRQALAKRDYRAAMTAFSGCLLVDPKNPRVLSELGFAAYKAGELPAAARFSQQAIEFSAESDLKGASYYNLGLIAEARGDKAAAIAAYKSSLGARQNSTVRAQLATLDAAAAAALDPFVPQPMTTLHPNLEAFCKAQKAVNKGVAASYDQDYDGDGPKMKCRCDPKPIENGGLAKPTAPYRAVRIFSNRCERGGGMSDASLTDYYFALQTADGWRVESIASLEARHYCWEDLKLESLIESDVIPGGAREILIRWSQSYGCRSGATKDTTYLRVAGIGPSGKPSLTPTITLSTEQTGEPSHTSDEDAPITRSVLDFSFDKSGRLILKNREGARKDPDLGAHPLVFP